MKRDAYFEACPAVTCGAYFTARRPGAAIRVTATELSRLRAACAARSDHRHMSSWLSVGVSAGFHVLLAAAYVLWPQTPSGAAQEQRPPPPPVLILRPAPREAPPATDPRQTPPPLEEQALALLQSMPDQNANAPALDLPPLPDAGAMPGFAAIEAPRAAAVARPFGSGASDGDGFGTETNYWEGVRAAIAFKLQYPPAARRLGLEGSASVRVTLVDGGLLDAEPVQATDPLFLQIVLRAVADAAPFAASSNAPGAAVSAVLPIRFRLRDTAGVDRDRW